MPLAIATSALRIGVENKLRILGIQAFFDVIITADDTREHKPHPESYVTAMKRLGVDPSRSIVFEDSLADVEAGKAAGAIVVGFIKYSPEKIDLPGVALTIDDWDQIDYEKLNELVANYKK